MNLSIEHSENGPRRHHVGQADGQRGIAVEGLEAVVQYGNVYRLCYIRGPEGILIGLAEQLGQQTSRANPLNEAQT